MTPKVKKVGPPARKKKYVPRPKVVETPCKHCGQIFTFDVMYCPICKSHGHIAVNGNNPEGCCACLRGATPPGQARMRGMGTWTGIVGIEGEYDNPEFYDGLQEICNMTVMPVWNNYESGNAH
jgi:hypothetical protein